MPIWFTCLALEFNRKYWNLNSIIRIEMKMAEKQSNAHRIKGARKVEITNKIKTQLYVYTINYLISIKKTTL